MANEYRDFGKFDFSANLEVQSAAPLDSRQVIKSAESLNNKSTWKSTDDKLYYYKGMMVVCLDDLGIYVLNNDNPTFDEDSSIGTTPISQNWNKIATATGEVIQVIDGLNSSSTTNALSANQGRVLKEMIDAIEVPGIVNDLTTGGADKALSAEQGKVLKGMIDAIEVPEVVDNLTTDDGTKALSAKQGKYLNDTKSSIQIFTGLKKLTTGSQTGDIQTALGNTATGAIITLLKTQNILFMDKEAGEGDAVPYSSMFLVSVKIDTEETFTLSFVDGTSCYNVSFSIAEGNYSVTKTESVSIKSVEIVNDLTTGGTDKALSAEQGKVLNTAHTELKSDFNTFKGLKGQTNGLAELDSTGKVPTAQLPSYVDDVVEFQGIYATKGNVPVEGLVTDGLYYVEDEKKFYKATNETTLAEAGETPEAGKIYVNVQEKAGNQTAAKDTTWRWAGDSAGLVMIGSSLALGETTGTAYDGAKGAKTTATVNSLPETITIISSAETASAGSGIALKGSKWAKDGESGLYQETQNQEVVVIAVASVSQDGLMSKEDKTKLDAIPSADQILTKTEASSTYVTKTEAEDFVTGVTLESGVITIE